MITGKKLKENTISNITSVKAHYVVNLSNCCPSPLRVTGGSLTLLQESIRIDRPAPCSYNTVSIYSYNAVSQIQDRVISRKVTEALTDRDLKKENQQSAVLVA